MRTPVGPHICLDERGIAYIEETETKVSTVVRNKKVSRDTPEQLRANMPHLTLAQVYAALAYYLDHTETIDAQIAALDQRAETLLARQPAPLTREELLARRARPRSRTSVR